MRVPLELLRLILWHFRNDGRCQPKDLWLLRLVNRTFCEELTEFMYTGYEPWMWATFNAGTWATAPWRLRMGYLHYKIRRQEKEPNMFAWLFLPVFERHVAALGIANDDEERRQQVMDELLSLPMQDADGRDKAMTYVHSPDMFTTRKDFFYGACSKSRKKGRPKSAEQYREEQIASDWEFAKTCLAIKNDDYDLVARRLAFGHSGVLEPSACFGTTLLKFALKYGDLAKFTVVLGHVGHEYFEKATKRTYDIFNVAESEDVDIGGKVDLLMEEIIVCQHESARQKTVQDMFIRARSNDYYVLLDRTICWMKKNMDDKRRQNLMDTSFRIAISGGRHDILQRMSLEVDIKSKFAHPRTGVMGTPIEAALDNHLVKVSVLKSLLEFGADVNQSKEAFHTAAQTGHIEWLAVMLEAGYRLDTREEVLRIVRDVYNIKRTELLNLLQTHGWDKQDVAIHDASYFALHDCSANGCGSLRLNDDEG